LSFASGCLISTRDTDVLEPNAVRDSVHFESDSGMQSFQQTVQTRHDSACHDKDAQVCIHYTFESETDRDAFRKDCAANYVGLDHTCPGGAGYYRHTTPTRTADTYDYQFDSATLKQLCTDTKGSWNP